MGIKDQEMFEKLRDELNLVPRKVEGRGECGDTIECTKFRVELID